MDISTALSSGMDPNLLAMLGNTAGSDPTFTKLLMQSLNPNPGGTLKNQIGAPSLDNINALAGNAPELARADPAPQLSGPQSLQSLGFGMAGAAAKPGSNALSALGEGGTQMLNMGGQQADRAIHEAQQENNAAIQEWQGKSALAEKALGAQMEEPALDVKMADLTGSTLGHQAQLADTAAYRAGLLGDKSTGRVIQQQNADTRGQNADTAATKVDLYGQSLDDKNTRFEAAQALKEKQIKERADQFVQSMAARAAQSGAALSERDKQGAANMYARLVGQQSIMGPLTPEADAHIQKQVQQAFPGAPAGGGQAAAPAAIAKPAVVPSAPATQSPATASMMSATNPKTGQKAYSSDGGATWTDEAGTPL